MSKKRTISLLSMVLIPAFAVGVGLALGSQSLAALNAADATSPQALVGSGFTYQGRLTDDGGNPVNDTCSLDFTLWDAESGGTLIGHQIVTGIEVNDGYLAVLLNNGGEFGENAFRGKARWLKIAVKCSSDAGWNILPGRQPLSAAPYALSLRPGAMISGTVVGKSILTVVNGDGGGGGLVGYSSDATGVRGLSMNGFGVEGISVNQVAVYGESANNAAGLFTSTHSFGVTGNTFSDDPQVAAVEGQNEGGGPGVAGYGNDGPGGYFANEAGGTVLYAAGAVAQDATADGLVKAAVYAHCGQHAVVHRYFNTVGGEIYTGSWGLGWCHLYFDFDLSERFWIAMAYNDTNATIVSCTLSSTHNDSLLCMRWYSDGSPTDGDMMVLVY